MKKPFYWFQGESVRKLAEELAEGGSDARLEVRIDKGKMTFTVVGAAYNGTVNESHVCPPDCPPHT